MFLPFGVGGRIRSGALCPGCCSLERDRAAWLHLDVLQDRLKPGLRLLHVAPERSIEPRLRKRLGASYVTADLMRQDVDRVMSIEDIPFGDGEFDAVICNHVLEHVEDDRRALREVRRVLAAGGWALLQVPVFAGIIHTREDSTVTSPHERRRLYGQHDHVRAYGSDYVERLREAGFEPELISLRQRHSRDEIVRFGLDPDETLYICHRAAA
jgi:SAM-dependent methyltransferase